MYWTFVAFVEEFEVKKKRERKGKWLLQLSAILVTMIVVLSSFPVIASTLSPVVDTAYLFENKSAATSRQTRPIQKATPQESVITSSNGGTWED